MNHESESEQRNLSSGYTSLTPGVVVFEKFEIIEELGKGGMGVVLKVRDTNLDKHMALKVLNGQIKEINAVRRFQNEARNASRLTHYAVARIYDFGVSSYGEPFMAVELIDGETLNSFVKRNRCLNLEDFYTVFTDVLSGLDAAHKASIVHRDLKPGNVMVFTDESRRLRAKLLDFGISKRIDVSEEELGKLTSTGQIIGTPLYLSPEQAIGEPAVLQSDLYSLGCVMYFALAGAPPFQGDTAFDTLRMHRESEAEPITTCADFSSVPNALSKLIARLLSKSPSDRPTSARDAKQQLSDCFGRENETQIEEDSGATTNGAKDDGSTDGQKRQTNGGKANALPPVLTTTVALALLALVGKLILDVTNNILSAPAEKKAAARKRLEGTATSSAASSDAAKSEQLAGDPRGYIQKFMHIRMIDTDWRII